VLDVGAGEGAGAWLGDARVQRRRTRGGIAPLGFLGGVATGVPGAARAFRLAAALLRGLSANAWQKTRRRGLAGSAPLAPLECPHPLLQLRTAWQIRQCLPSRALGARLPVDVVRVHFAGAGAEFIALGAPVEPAQGLLDHGVPGELTGDALSRSGTASARSGTPPSSSIRCASRAGICTGPRRRTRTPPPAPTGTTPGARPGWGKAPRSAAGAPRPSRSTAPGGPGLLRGLGRSQAQQNPPPQSWLGNCRCGPAGVPPGCSLRGWCPQRGPQPWGSGGSSGGGLGRARGAAGRPEGAVHGGAQEADQVILRQLAHRVAEVRGRGGVLSGER